MKLVQVEEFCGFIYVNLDVKASSLSKQSGNLEDEIRYWAPDVENLTFGHRLTYDIKSNWKRTLKGECPVFAEFNLRLNRIQPKVEG